MYRSPRLSAKSPRISAQDYSFALFCAVNLHMFILDRPVYLYERINHLTFSCLLMENILS